VERFSLRFVIRDRSRTIIIQSSSSIDLFVVAVDRLGRNRRRRYGVVRTRTVTVGLLDPSGSRSALASGLGGELLPGSLSSGRLAGGLLGTSHGYELSWLRLRKGIRCTKKLEEFLVYGLRFVCSKWKGRDRSSSKACTSANTLAPTQPPATERQIKRGNDPGRPSRWRSPALPRCRVK